MEEKELKLLNRIKKAGFWLKILTLHFLRQPGILIPFAGILAGTFLLSLAELDIPVRIRAAVCTDDSTFAKDVFRQLSRKDSMIQFYLCENQKEMELDVASGRAECGYYLDAGILARLDDGDREDIIDTCRSPGTIVKGIADELVFSGILSVYSPQWYTDYMVKMLIKGEKELMENNNHQETEAAVAKAAEAIAAKAAEEYEAYRSSQATFQFRFSGDTGLPESYEDADSSGQAEGIPIIRLRGIIAVMILAGALSGTAAYQKDRASHRFLAAGHPWAVEMTSYAIVITFACLTGLSGLRLTGEWSGLLPELQAMSCYAALLLLYCMLAARVFPSEVWIVSFIPFAMVGSLVLAPVFFDISQISPLTGFLKWGTPVSVYLSLI